MSPSACSRLNQPSPLTSKTRSNSRRLLVGQDVADLEPAGVDEHVDAPAGASRGDGRDRLRRVAQVDAVVVRRAARRRAPPSIAPSAARARSIRASSRRPRRRRALAARLHALDEIALEPVAVGGEALAGRDRRLRLRHEVEQVERAARAAARSAVIAEVMLPAAPVTTNTVSRRERARRVGGRLLGEARRSSAASSRVADLDRARVAQRLVEQRVRQLGGLAPGREVDDLDQRLGALALVGLGEAGDGAADADGARRVVAVPAAEARRGDEEGARGRRSARRARASSSRAASRARAVPRASRQDPSRRAAPSSSRAGSQ